MRSLLAALILLIASAGPALAQDEGESRVVKDPARLTADVVSVIREGQVATLEDKLHRYGRRDRAEVGVLVSGVTSILQNRVPLYVDKIAERRIGSAFYESMYGAFYGEQTFLFFRLTLAKVEDGWILLSFAFDTDPEGYLY